MQELRDAVLDFRKSGKTVVAFLEYGGDREYYLASAADRVFLLPTSPLDLTGVASYEIFLRGTLDKIGAYPDFLHVGDYKTAVNQLTEKGFTPAHREMTESLNRDMYEQLVRGIARRGRRPSRRARADRSGAVRRPRRRCAPGSSTISPTRISSTIGCRSCARRRRDRVASRGPTTSASARARSAFRPRSRIAVLYAVGTIVSGRSGFDPVNGAVVGSDTIVEQIRRVRDDDSIRAIVLRIDSPGGSSIASDVIWRELMITRDHEAVAAADRVDVGPGGVGRLLHRDAGAGRSSRSPATLTGSIGIYTGKIVARRDAGEDRRHDRDGEVGRNADIYSPFTPFSPAQRAQGAGLHAGLLRQLRREGGRVAQDDAGADRRRGAGTRLDRAAGARARTGRRARRAARAIAIAKERAGIPTDEDVELVVYPPRRSIYEALTEQFGTTGPARGACSPETRSAGDRGADGAGAAVPARRAAGADAVAFMRASRWR